jgi:hypothetical protein
METLINLAEDYKYFLLITSIYRLDSNFIGSDRERGSLYTCAWYYRS